MPPVEGFAAGDALAVSLASEATLACETLRADAIAGQVDLFNAVLRDIWAAARPKRWWRFGR